MVQAPIDSRECSSFHSNESGQVTLMFVFCSIALVVLLGFLLNTAQVTSRKVEMQGAADSAAVGGAVWVARGMNLMVMDNNTMVNVLAVMIEVHATRQTFAAMVGICNALADALLLVAPEISAILYKDAGFYLSQAGPLASLDLAVSQAGWKILAALDALNQAIKLATPALALLGARSYGAANRADGVVGSLILSGGPIQIPEPPVARGQNQELAKRAGPVARSFETPVVAATWVLCAPILCISPPLMYPVLGLAITANVNSLGGGSVSDPSPTEVTAEPIKNAKNSAGMTLGSLLDKANAAAQAKDPNAIAQSLSGKVAKIPSLLEPLRWPDDPPRPMILTDRPTMSGSAIVGSTRSLNYFTVHRYLQFLSISTGKSRDALIAPRRFENPKAPYGQFTYAQADVYNPSSWDMFDQNWRAKLARVTILEIKAGQIGTEIGWTNLGNRADFSMVNTH